MDKVPDHMDYTKQVSLPVLRISKSLQPHESPTANTSVSLWGGNTPLVGQDLLIIEASQSQTHHTR